MASWPSSAGLTTQRPRSAGDKLLLHIVARGKIGRSSEADLVERYLKRIPWPTKVTELSDKGREAPPPAPSSVSVLLDERGQALSSSELALKLEHWRDAGVREARVVVHDQLGD